MRPLSLEEKRSFLNEQREEFKGRLGELMEEMNVRFDSLKNEMGGHAHGLRKHVTDEVNLIQRMFDEATTNFGGHNVTGKYGKFQDYCGGDMPHHDG